MSTEERIPSAPGWWARRAYGKIDWHDVLQLEDMGLAIFLDAMNEPLPISHFCTPLTRWYGPIELPWKERA